MTSDALAEHLKAGFALAAGAAREESQSWLTEWGKMTAKMTDDAVTTEVAIAKVKWIEETGTCPMCGGDPETHEQPDF